MICYTVAHVIYNLHCINTLLKLGPLFLTKIIKLYDLNILIAWLKCGQIGYNIIEQIMRNSILLGVLGMNLGLICITIILIRLNHQLSTVMSFAALIGFFSIVCLVKIVWGILATVNSDTRCCINCLVKLNVLDKIT